MKFKSKTQTRNVEFRARVYTTARDFSQQRRAGFRSWARIYFYAFDLTAADVSALSHGSTDGLERRRLQPSPGGPDVNHSRAALHFLLDKDLKLSNASFEVPGLTCTIVVEASTASTAVQTFRFDGRKLQVRAKGTSVCDLTAIKGGKRSISWDVDVDIPAFANR